MLEMLEGGGDRITKKTTWMRFQVRRGKKQSFVHSCLLDPARVHEEIEDSHGFRRIDL